jgi:hypothetical protein
MKSQFGCHREHGLLLLEKRGTLCNEILDVNYEINKEYACGENEEFLVLNLFVYLHSTRL